jgi:hypothetical protein
VPQESDRRTAPPAPRALDASERAAADEFDVRPELPLLIAIPNVSRVQAIALPGAQRDVPGVSIELSNAVISMTWPMGLAQAREHVRNVERAILEAQAPRPPS